MGIRDPLAIPEIVPLWLGNLITTFILLVALVHVFAHAAMYITALIDIARHGSRSSRAPQRRVRQMALLYLCVFILYNGILYAYVLNSIRWSLLGDLVNVDWEDETVVAPVFEGQFGYVLYYELVTLLLVTWLKVACAAIEYRRLRHLGKGSELAQSPRTARVSGFQKDRRRSSHPSGTAQAALTSVGSASGRPEVTIVMPIYNEPLEILLESIRSVYQSDYSTRKLSLVLAFDDESLSATHLSVVTALSGSQRERLLNRTLSVDSLQAIAARKLQNTRKSTLKAECPPVRVIDFHGLSITLCRFKHGGKKHAQMNGKRWTTDHGLHIWWDG